MVNKVENKESYGILIVGKELQSNVFDSKFSLKQFGYISDEKQLNDYIEIKDFQSIGFSILEIQSFNSKTNNEILQMIDEKVEQLETKLELSIYIKKKYFGGYEK